MKKETSIKVAQPNSLISLRKYMQSNAHPLLCLGPMSKNAVDAAIEYSNRIKQPIPLIASRRQIDSAELGGGYVNGWNTQNFAEYVREQSDGYIHLCRDHGGPWQGENEEKLSASEAMERAKISSLDDIACGFDIIHIDTSLCGRTPNSPTALESIFELYAFVCEAARTLGQSIEIEIGAEQQSGYLSDAEEFVDLLTAVTDFAEKENYPAPLFCVAQTGTLVKEMRNIGLTEGRKNELYDQKYAVDHLERRIRYLAELAHSKGMYIKEHNGDYLSDGSMSLRRSLGVGGVNVAPELGVFESKRLVSLAFELGLKKEAEAMLELFYFSRKWEKWLRIDSTASDIDKALIAGHYTFASEAFNDIKKSIQRKAKAQLKLNLDEYLREGLVSIIQRMAWCLGYLHQKAEFQRVTAPVVKNIDSSEEMKNDGAEPYSQNSGLL